MFAMDKRPTILIIDDHDCIRLLLGSILSKNYEVVTKKDGLEGMAWLSNGNIPDLILLDLVMPSLNGYEFLQNIRTSGFFKNIPVLILSGTEDQVEKDRCFQLGIRDFFNKPFNPIQLKAKIQAIFSNTDRPVETELEPSTAFFRLAAG